MYDLAVILCNYIIPIPRNAYLFKSFMTSPFFYLNVII
jgi:hypothetical protein